MKKAVLLLTSLVAAATAAGARVGRETGAQVLVLPPSVGGVKDITDYFKLFDYDVNLLTSSIRQAGKAGAK